MKWFRGGMRKVEDEVVSRWYAEGWTDDKIDLGLIGFREGRRRGALLGVGTCDEDDDFDDDWDGGGKVYA